MGKQWVRQEIKRDIVADYLGQATAWIQLNRNVALGVAGGALAAVAVAIIIVLGVLRSRDQAWRELAIAQSYAYQGHPDRALDQLKVFDTQYTQTPASNFGALFSGDVLYRLGKYKEAAQAYQALVDRLPSKTVQPIALSDVGLSQEAAGDCKSAVDTDQRFLDTFPDHFLAPQVHASLARCLDTLGLKDKAKATYERIALMYPDSYWAQWAQTRLKS